MDWLKIGSALLLGTMVILVWPQAMKMLKESPKGSSDDWKGALLPIALVVGFVLLLMAMV